MAAARDVTRMAGAVTSIETRLALLESPLAMRRIGSCHEADGELPMWEMRATGHVCLTARIPGMEKSGTFRDARYFRI